MLMTAAIVHLTFCGFIGGAILSKVLLDHGKVLAAALAFGLCDGLAALLSGIAAPYYSFVEMAVVAAYATAYACRPSRLAAAAGLPLLMSLCCLADGTPSDAGRLAIVGSLMAVMGIAFGRIAFQRPPRRYEAMPVVAALVLIH